MLGFIQLKPKCAIMTKSITMCKKKKILTSFGDRAILYQILMHALLCQILLPTPILSFIFFHASTLSEVNATHII